MIRIRTLVAIVLLASTLVQSSAPQLLLQAGPAWGEIRLGDKIETTIVVWPVVQGDPANTVITGSFGPGVEVVGVEAYPGTCTRYPRKYSCQVPLPGPQASLIYLTVQTSLGTGVCPGRLRVTATAETGEKVETVVGVQGVHCQYFPTFL